MTKPRLFQLIDLDRTLFDTSKFAKALTDEINASHPGLGTELDARFEEAYKKEETFFMLRYLRNEWGDAWFEDLVNVIVEKHGVEAFIFPAMRERLAVASTLTDYEPSWGILSYGDEVDQRMKIRIIGLEHAPLYLSDTPDKGDIITAWQTAKGTFLLPEVFGSGEVDVLTFEDDKLRAFHNLPKGVTGLWITHDPHAEQRIHDEGLGSTVVPVKGLLESLHHIKEKYA